MRRQAAAPRAEKIRKTAPNHNVHFTCGLCAQRRYSLAGGFFQGLSTSGAMLISNLLKAAWQRIEGALASGSLEADSVHRERKQRPLQLMVLEKRVMFSATPLGVDVLPQNQQPGLDPGQSADATLPPPSQADGASGPSTQVPDQTVLDSAPAAATTPATPSETDIASEVDSTGADAQAQQRLELVFVNGDVPDYQRLLEDLAAQSETPTRYESFVLDSSRDGVEQISQTLAACHDVDTIHLVSSGSDGAIKLGSVWLDSTNLSAYAGDVARWGDALKVGGELLLHNNSLTASAEGRTLLEAMQALAGADTNAGSGLAQDNPFLSVGQNAGVTADAAPVLSDADLPASGTSAGEAAMAHGVSTGVQADSNATQRR